MIFTFAYVPWWRVSTQPVLVGVTEYMLMSTSTGTNSVTLELWSTSKVRVPYIQYSSTASTSTEYEYPTPGCRNVLGRQSPVSISDKTSYRETRRRKIGFKYLYCFGFWQARRQQHYQDACHISERSGNSKYKSCGFETLFRFLSPLQSILQCTLSISRCFFLLRCFHWESLIFCHTLSLIAISRMAFRDIHCTTGLDDWVVNTCDGSFTFSDNL